MTSETLRLALDPSAEQEAAPGVAKGSPARRLEPFLKGLGSSDTGANGQILIIMSEPELAMVLAYCLTAAGFRVRQADQDVDGALAIQRDFPDVVLLDSRLPGFRSSEIWRQVRSVDAGRRAPAVVMFIRSEDDIDPRLGLDLGPCDFVLYPFGVRDLVLRVDSLVRLRRDAPPDAPAPRRRNRYIVGPLDLDVDRHTAIINDTVVQLSPLELRLLAYLVTQADRVCSRAELMTEVWGYRAGVMTRAADIHVKRLRDKLGSAASLIVTIRGTGYRLSTEFPVVLKAS